MNSVVTDIKGLSIAVVQSVFNLADLLIFGPKSENQQASGSLARKALQS